MTTKRLNPERLLFSDRDLVKILIALLSEQCLTNVVGHARLGHEVVFLPAEGVVRGNPESN